VTSIAPSKHESRKRADKLMQDCRRQCSRTHFDSAVTLIGFVPHDCVTLAISQSTISRPTVNNRELRPNEIIVLYSGEFVRYTCEPHETLFTLTTNVEHYQQCVANHSLIDVLANRQAYRFQVANFKLMQSAIDVFNAYLTSPHESPLKQRNRHEHSFNEDALLVALIRALTPVGRCALRPPTRRKIATEAIEYIHQNPNKPLNMKVLVKQLQTTTRSLHHGFVETFGTSPIAYIRNLRLAHVRRDLIRNTWPTVTETAMHWNFHHLSRFSKAYQDAYGETPSETSRRNRTMLAAPKNNNQ